MIAIACADGGLICIPLMIGLGIAGLLGWRHHKQHHCCESEHECGEEAHADNG